MNNTTVWSDPALGQPDRLRLLRASRATAERGKFDFFFLAEGLRLREQRGQIHDLDVVGRPDTLTVLAALAAVTDHLGLAGTVNATFNEPYEVARQLATPRPPVRRPGRLERRHLLRRLHRRELPPRRLPRPRRPLRARRGVPADRPRAVGLLGRATDLVADQAPGTFCRGPAPGRSPTAARHFDIARPLHRAAQPAGPPGDHPGRRLRRGPGVRRLHRRRDLLPARHAGGRAGLLPRRQGPAGRARPAPGRPEDPARRPPSCSATPTPRPRRTPTAVRRQQVSPQTAILLLEQVWNRDLSALRPRRPAAGRSTRTLGRDVDHPGPGRGCTADPLADGRGVAGAGRGETARIRDLIIEVTGRQSFIGSPARVAEDDQRVRAGPTPPTASSSCRTSRPAGLDDFVDKVVPLLQERGVFRAEYETSTLRDHLGLENDRDLAPGQSPRSPRSRTVR